MKETDFFLKFVPLCFLCPNALSLYQEPYASIQTNCLEVIRVQWFSFHSKRLKTGLLCQRLKHVISVSSAKKSNNISLYPWYTNISLAPYLNVIVLHGIQSLRSQIICFSSIKESARRKKSWEQVDPQGIRCNNKYLLKLIIYKQFHNSDL